MICLRGSGMTEVGFLFFFLQCAAYWRWGQPQTPASSRELDVGVGKARVHSDRLIFLLLYSVYGILNSSYF